MITEADVVQMARSGIALRGVIFDESEVAYVASLFWKFPAVNKTTQYGNIFVPPCEENPKNLRPSVIPVYAALVHKDKGDDQWEPQRVTAKDRAEDIAKDVRHFGVFVSEGSHPTKAECRVALAELEKYYHDQLERADTAWARTGDRRTLPGHGRVAAEYFGVTRDWLSDPIAQAICEGCKMVMPEGAVKCPNPACGAIADWQRALDLGVLSQFQYEQGVRLGKLPSLEGNAKASRKSQPEL